MSCETLALNIEDFELPDDAKVTRVFSRLKAIQNAFEEEMMDSYDESYSAHNNTYGIGF